MFNTLLHKLPSSLSVCRKYLSTAVGPWSLMGTCNNIGECIFYAELRILGIWTENDTDLRWQIHHTDHRMSLQSSSYNVEHHSKVAYYFSVGKVPDGVQKRLEVLYNLLCISQDGNSNNRDKTLVNHASPDDTSPTVEFWRLWWTMKCHHNSAFPRHIPNHVNIIQILH